MAKKSSKLTASSKAVDPTLDALFSASAGPAKPHPRAKYSEAPPPRPKQPSDESDKEGAAGDDDEDDEDMVDADADLSELSEDAEGESSEEEDVEDAVERLLEPPRKPKERKRKRDEDDLEGKYLNKLALEEEKEEAQSKRQRSKKEEAPKADDKDDTSSDASGEDASNDKEVLPVHESLAPKEKDATKDTDVDKANRTVFLANVAAEASTSKTAKKTLMSHLSTVLEKGEKIESIRFRSLAFSTGSMPKRAAYITHSLMDATTKSANAYVVFSTPAAARKACTTLNGTVVLDRHLRVDSVAHPSPVDHRRCVFVGNLGFVDDETVLNTDASGETKERKRNKVPSDIEEGLWRVFGKDAGKVENVRVIRDPKTRVGKGFAYVQFYDGNHVESALLLNEKKFPPMLPRALRVTRAKAPHKTALAQERTKAKTAGDKADKKSTKYKQKATPEQLSMAGRASKLLGRSGALYDHKKKGPRGGEKKEQASGSGLVLKTPEEIIFEGKRASANDGRPSDVRIGKKKGRVNKGRVEKKGRGAVRAAAWRKDGSKKGGD
ncbi:hypothetical protein ACHAQA_004233 [Verticillium albo-atrum]